MSAETLTTEFWQLSSEIEAQRRGDDDGSPVVTLAEMAQLADQVPDGSALGRAVDAAFDRLPCDGGDGSQSIDLARMRAKLRRPRAYAGRDPVWYWRPGIEVWIAAEVSHFDRPAQHWCVRCDGSGLVCYAEEHELRPRHPGEIAPDVWSFGA